MTEPVDMEALRIKAQRAKELLNEAGWLFDGYITDETATLLATAVEDGAARERSYNLIRAAADVTPRTVLDPRVGFRYLATLTSRLVKLQGGLALRAILTTSDVPTTAADRSNVRSIA